MGGITGLFGLPFVDLAPYLDLSGLAEVHEEICLALTRVPVDYTGGGHRSMGIMPTSREAEALVDYGEAIRAMTDDDFRTFVSLSDDPRAIDLVGHRRDALAFGEERDHPLSRRQMLWLKFRFGVYFPWKVYVELIPNRLWTEKAAREGKDFTRQARAFFPKTIAFVKTLPFESIGRCNVMGLEAHDHGTVHRDGDPAEQKSPDHFITVCPAGNKRLFVLDESAAKTSAASQKKRVASRAYWFNDHDYHGVDADPFFRYSVRIDGVFHAELLERLARDHDAPLLATQGP